MAKRAGNGNGSYRVLPNGKVCYRISYRDECGKLKRKSFTGVDEYECLQLAEVFLGKQAKIKSGIDVDATIPDILKARYDEDLRNNFVGVQGYSRNISCVQIIERSALGRIPIGDVTERDITDFLMSLTRYANSTISKLYHKIKLAYKVAMSKDIVDYNLVELRNIRCPKSGKKNKKIRGLTLEEQSKFTTALIEYKFERNRNNYRNQLFIELYTGLRMGEINALSPEAIDFENGLIHVRRTISKGLNYKQFVKEGTKTAAGTRDVPITKQVEAYLIDAVNNYKPNPNNLLFVDVNNGSLITTSQVNLFYRRICEKAGIEFLGQHALRHTFATRCIEAGIPPVVLKKWMGHSKISMTLDIYADVFDNLSNKSTLQYESYIEKLANNNLLAG